MEDHETRISALEEAVTALTAAAASRVSDPTEEKASSDDVFWALAGLQERTGEHGGVVFAGEITPPGAEEPVRWQAARPGDALMATDWSALSGALAALGHPTRLTLLQAVLNGTTTVAELAKKEEFGTTGQIYHHLSQLTGAGWLRTTTRGRHAVPPERIIPLLAILAAVI
ncbi:MAG: ArsR/SmtB family transcription factor [Propionibacteriaceae bacterium]